MYVKLCIQRITTTFVDAKVKSKNIYEKIINFSIHLCYYCLGFQNIRVIEYIYDIYATGTVGTSVTRVILVKHKTRNHFR